MGSAGRLGREVGFGWVKGLNAEESVQLYPLNRKGSVKQCTSLYSRPQEKPPHHHPHLYVIPFMSCP